MELGPGELESYDRVIGSLDGAAEQPGESLAVIRRHADAWENDRS
ncbi:hypothetical protein [Pseudonocardia sp. HH130630-07]|nr:hypothetical protein [Pseudonocardia sp. HH130630-07]